MDRQRISRVPLILLAIFALLMAIWGGLQRMGWSLPSFNPILSLSHGQLMIGGFLGTVIGLERAVVTKKFWGYIGPLATGIGALLIVTDFSPLAGAFLITVGSVILVAMFLRFMKTSRSLHLSVMAAGALSSADRKYILVSRICRFKSFDVVDGFFGTDNRRRASGIKPVAKNYTEKKNPFFVRSDTVCSWDGDYHFPFRSRHEAKRIRYARSVDLDVVIRSGKKIPASARTAALYRPGAADWLCLAWCWWIFGIL